MTVELIPVLEINSQDISLSIEPYLPGSSFYKLSDISKDVLMHLTKVHTEDLRKGKYSREQASAFFGGYILRVNGQDKFFPQCCGDLSDITFWDQVAGGNGNAYYEGHPAPTLKIKNDIITFDFSVENFEESFKPIPPETIVKVEQDVLKNAVEKAKEELKILSKRLLKINEDEHLGIENIDSLLVWDNPNQI